MKKSILFVDDEPKVLEALQRSLRPMRREWDMTFADGGAKALEVLAAKPVDVIVTDMRMPGMDGCRLLAEVRTRHPRVVRIILSGHSDRETILKSVGPAHQYLPKPCDTETLKTTIARACALRALLTDESLVQVVSRVESLPSLPSLYSEVVRELESPYGSIQKVEQIISRDLGMTAKILHMANSAFFGLPQHVSSPARAVRLLGLETVKALVLTVQIFSQFPEARLPGFSIEDLWHHSMTTGVFAKKIAKEEKQDPHALDDSFMAGLLHDIGKLVVLANFPDRYGEILHRVRETGASMWESEQAVLGSTHAQVGAYLMGLWGLPDSIVEAIAYHHCPQDCLGRSFSSLTAVHAANAFAAHAPRREEMEGIPHLRMDYLEALQLAHRVPRWREICGELTREEDAP